MCPPLHLPRHAAVLKAKKDILMIFSCIFRVLPDEKEVWVEGVGGAAAAAVRSNPHCRAPSAARTHCQVRKLSLNMAYTMYKTSLFALWYSDFTIGIMWSIQ